MINGSEQFAKRKMLQQEDFSASVQVERKLLVGVGEYALLTHISETLVFNHSKENLFKP